MASEIELLSDRQLLEWMEASRWIYAATMPRHPHEYSLKREQDPDRFERVVLTIHERGYDRSYLNRPWRSLDVGEHYVWYHSDPREVDDAEELVRVTILINRAPRLQEQLV